MSDKIAFRGLKASVVALGLALAPLAASAPSEAAVTARYVGSIASTQAVAIVRFERFRRYVSMTGKINSGAYQYAFEVNIVGNSGYGTMVSLREGTRFRVHVLLTANGFVLTANPFRGRTSYTFIRG